MPNSQVAPAKTFFNYGAVEKDVRAVLKQEAICIKAAGKRTHDNILEIGARLIHAKEVAGHGNFMSWIDHEFGLTYDKANDFMNAANAFSKLELNPTLNLSQTAIFALSAPSVSEEIRESAIAKVEVGTIKTVADVKEHIAESKSPQNGHAQEPGAVTIETKAPEPVVPPGLAVATRSEPEKTSEPDIHAQIDALPVAQALKLFKHTGRIFRDQAEIYYEQEYAIKAAKRSLNAIRHTTGPVTDAIKTLATIPPPENWLGCGTCKGSMRYEGNPCHNCKGGFTIYAGEGVSADVVRDYAESVTESVQ